MLRAGGLLHFRNKPEAVMQQPAPGLRGIGRAAGEPCSSLAPPDECWETAACSSIKSEKVQSGPQESHAADTS